MPVPDPMQVMKLGRLESEVKSALSRLDGSRFLERFLARDPTLWKDGEDHARVIRNRMGWLDVAGSMLSRVGELQRFAQEVKSSGVRHVVLLGMGGSSLCPDVLRQTFRRGRGFPALLVLDSTDPEAIAAIDKTIKPERSLFIVASKSGTTLESRMFQRYFASKAPASRFVAITDPGTPLEEEARRDGFRRVFTNPPDIGGRYSALSCFGMVPAACLGIDVRRLLERGDAMAKRLQTDGRASDCPPAVLGAALGALGLAGRDKVTFVASRPIARFGYWVEQLIAESTGKEGKGLVPVEGEPLGPPSCYRRDRVFVQLKVRGERETSIDRRLAALRRAGHPVITILLHDLYDLGAEFNRWEIATAVAGSVLGIDPFDEPNVKESKDNTDRVLTGFRSSGALPSTPPDWQDDGMAAWTNIPSAPGRAGRPDPELRALLDGLCRAIRPGDYVAIMAYLKMDDAAQDRLLKLRTRLRDRCRVATTLGFGPRFLHSTGQLHKGGAGNGVFVQITADRRQDLEIPGEPYSFGVLQSAQAAGDRQSLTQRDYRVLRVHLGRNRMKDLDRMVSAVPVKS